MQDTITGEHVKLNCVVADKNVTIRDRRNLSGCETIPYYLEKMSWSKEVIWKIKIVFIASECQPFFASGLGDVIGSLPKNSQRERSDRKRYFAALFENQPRLAQQTALCRTNDGSAGLAQAVLRDLQI